MSRNFQAIADFVRTIDDLTERKRAADKLAYLCGQWGKGSQRFNRARWLAACGC